jgi:hypothetical protein
LIIVFGHRRVVNVRRPPLQVASMQQSATHRRAALAAPQRQQKTCDGPTQHRADPMHAGKAPGVRSPCSFDALGDGQRFHEARPEEARTPPPRPPELSGTSPPVTSLPPPPAAASCISQHLQALQSICCLQLLHVHCCRLQRAPAAACRCLDDRNTACT